MNQFNLFSSDAQRSRMTTTVQHLHPDHKFLNSYGDVDNKPVNASYKKFFDIDAHNTLPEDMHLTGGYIFGQNGCGARRIFKRVARKISRRKSKYDYKYMASGDSLSCPILYDKQCYKQCPTDYDHPVIRRMMIDFNSMMYSQIRKGLIDPDFAISFEVRKTPPGDVSEYRLYVFRRDGTIFE